MSRAADLDIVREAIVTFLSDSGDKLVAFVAFVFFANYFSTDAFGAAYTVIGISAVAGSASKAAGSAVSKRVSEDTRAHDRFFLLGLGAHAGYALAVAAVVLLAVETVSLRFETFALAGVVHLSARPVLFLVERTYDGVGETGAAATLDFVDGVLTAGLRFLFVLGLGWGVEALLWSAALSALLVSTGAYLGRFGLPTTPPTRADLRSISEFTGPSLVARVGNAAYTNAPTVLAGTLLSPTVASFVKSARTLTQPAQLPVRSVVNSVQVQVSGNAERDESLTRPVQHGVDIAGVFALPLAAGGVALGDTVMVTAFGSGYANTAPVLVAVTVGTVFETYARILGSSLAGADHPGQVARANALQAAVFAPAYALAAWAGGVPAFLVVIVVASVVRLTVLASLTDRHVVDLTTLSVRFPLEQALATVVMFVTVLLLNRVVSVGSWTDLVLIVGSGGAVYGTTLLLGSSRCRSIVRTVLDRGGLAG